MSEPNTHSGGCHCGAVRFDGKTSDGKEMRAINVRCLDDLEDVRKLELQWFDGRSR